MRTLLVVLCLSSIIFFSKCETVEDPAEKETTGEDTCTKEEDDDNLSKDTCVSRTAKSSGLECCLLTFKAKEIKSSLCLSAEKSKAKEFVDKYKSETKKTTGLTVTAELVCESSILRFTSSLALTLLLLM